jgi:ribosomal protein S18 acetylase RimI-like enzyme
VHLRDAEARDLPLLAELNRQLIQDQGSSNSMSVAELEERMHGWLAAEYRAVLFEIDAQAVAYALFRPAEDGGVHLRQFFVARAFRRQGVGRRAFQAFRERFVPAGAALYLEVLVHNLPGLAFWRALGFQEHALSLRLPPSGSTGP